MAEYAGNGFWEKIGFTGRDDLVYRNKNIHELKPIDTSPLSSTDAF